MKIAFCIIDNMLATSLTWPSEMWLAAQSIHTASSKSANNIQMTTIGMPRPQDEKPNIHSIIQLDAIIDTTSGQTFDLIYLPALWRNPNKSLTKNKLLIHWINQQYKAGASICGTGSGCYFMAEAGLLNNKPATTHWHYFDKFAKKYPLIDLQRDHFITEADKLYCAASINSLADLTIHHITNHFGKSVANHVQRHFSHEIRGSYEQLTFSKTSYYNHGDEDILHIQLWLEDNFENTISINEVAKNNGMSERSLSRRFKSSTGKTISEYVQTIRITKAKELIRKSDLPLSTISEKSGFYDSSHFSKIFRKQTDLSPKEYRKITRKKLFQK